MSYALIGFLVFFFLFTFSLARLLRVISRIDRAKGWIKKEALVVEATKKTRGNPLALGNGGALFYCRYSHDNREFGSSIISFFGNKSPQSRRALRSLSPNMMTTIYINPKAHHEAVLLDPERHILFFQFVKVCSFLSGAVIFLITELV